MLDWSLISVVTVTICLFQGPSASVYPLLISSQARGILDTRLLEAIEVLDLRDFDLPLFEEKMSPAWGPSQSEAARAWQAKIDSLDGFIVLAAEYNRGPTGALKNALDYAYNEWNRKPVAFVGYGGVGGARAVEQLRLISIELQMAPIRTAVHILLPDFMAVMQGEKQLAEIEHLNKGADDMLAQFNWWLQTLTAARRGETQEAEAA